MIRAFYIILCLFVSAYSSGQVGIVKDKDGFVNVRTEASVTSRVSDTLVNERLVYCLEAEGDWFAVDYLRKGETHSGYIHKSRIQLLEAFSTFSIVRQNDTLLDLKYDSVQLTIKATKFISKGRAITWERPKDSRSYVKLIDGKQPWGTDGDMPKAVYKSITFKVGNTTLNFNRSQLSDLFEPNIDHTTACVDKVTGRIYISAINSDGAGAYIVTWVIHNNAVINREMIVPF